MRATVLVAPPEAVGPVHTLVLTNGETRTNLVISLDIDPATISGLVLDVLDRPVTNATVRLVGRGREYVTPDGQFTFDNLLPGGYSVTAVGPEPGFQSAVTYVVVGPGETQSGLLLRMMSSESPRVYLVKPGTLLTAAPVFYLGHPDYSHVALFNLGRPGGDRHEHSPAVAGWRRHLDGRVLVRNGPHVARQPCLLLLPGGPREGRGTACPCGATTGCGESAERRG